MGEAVQPSREWNHSNYQHGLYRGRDVYVVSTGPILLKTNSEYQTRDGIPPCQEGELSDHDAIYFVAQEVMKKLLRAGAEATGIPEEVAEFAGPLTKALAEDVERWVHESGGDIKKWLETIGASKTYAACWPTALVVPQGSEILSIEAFTDRKSLPPGSYKKGEKTFTRLPKGKWSRCAEIREEGKEKYFFADYAAWRMAEDRSVVTAVLLNWSNTDDLIGKLQVFFDPPEQWKSNHPFAVREGADDATV